MDEILKLVKIIKQQAKDLQIEVENFTKEFAGAFEIEQERNVDHFKDEQV